METISPPRPRRKIQNVSLSASEREKALEIAHYLGCSIPEAIRRALIEYKIESKN